LNDTAYGATFFENSGVSPFIDTEDDRLSTFAMDVDTASYTIARRFFNDGHLPNPGSVLIEEFINYFEQGYEPPEDEAFAIHMEAAPSQFGPEKYWLMRVGRHGQEIDDRGRNDAFPRF